MTTVYVLRGYHGEVLYVGISSSMLTRIAAHLRQKQWAKEIHSATFEHFETRSGAAARELDLIHELDPRYNIVGRRTLLRDEHLRQDDLPPIGYGFSLDDVG